jgi:hypothetical protein
MKSSKFAVCVLVWVVVFQSFCAPAQAAILLDDSFDNEDRLTTKTSRPIHLA